ncbi:hypothetical protein SUNI508_02426 [Seiridium unicorne]|uniref:Uncharacterized protein n=1 Tax=Seiridium unicorne TaxID=138068 RepID=A0ABR2UF29_9PEZI
MTGFLVPAWYKYQDPSQLDMNIASIIWGISLATTAFTAAKACRQTWTIWRRTRGINGYIAAVWMEWVASIIMGIIVWLFLWGAIEPSFQFFFAVLTFWTFQTQCVIQIIINRIALLMRDQRKVKRLQWGVGIGLGLVNLSVYLVWIPARLQISQTYISVNEIWDRLEKVIFCFIDAALNLYFIYLVRSKLISNGLQKYNRLFRFNMIMIACSMSLDVILIGVMSLGQGFVYVQFHPLVYIIKLHIELNMADLITKIALVDSGHSGYTGSKESQRNKSNSKGTRTDPMGVRMGTIITAGHDNNGFPKGGVGIQKTVETQIRRTDEEDNVSRTSSTTELRKDNLDCYPGS